jgi:hypothetical protein
MNINLDSLPKATQKPATGWSCHAAELAAYTMAYLANRTNAFGGYFSPEQRRVRVNAAGETKVDAAFTSKKELTTRRLLRHFRCQDHGWVTGLHAVGEDGNGRWICIDIDAHDANASEGDNWLNAQRVAAWFRSKGFAPLVEDSNGKGGYHVWIIFASPLSAGRLYAFARQCLAELFIDAEAFPKQPGKCERFGNWVRLPGLHHTRQHLSRFHDGENWLEGGEAVTHLLSLPLNNRADVPECAPADESPAPPEAHYIYIPPAPSSCTRPNGMYTDAEIARQIVAKIPNNGEHYDRWIAVGIALKDVENSPAMLDAWDAWSAKSGKHITGVCAEKWAGLPVGTPRNATKSPISIKSLVHWAKVARVEIDWFPPGAKRERWDEQWAYNAATGVKCADHRGREKRQRQRAERQRWIAVGVRMGMEVGAGL